MNKLLASILVLFVLIVFSTATTYAQNHVGLSCSACHLTHNAIGGVLTGVAGNANLCISCHNPTGTASNLSFDNSDKAIPGTGGTSHAWDVLAINSIYETNTTTDPEMLLRLPDGNIICSTCHNQHNSAPASPYLRVSNAGDAMCKDCHSARDIGRYIDDNTNNKGSHPVG